MNAIILSVGDELVLGQTVDTNSAWISQQLAAVGCDILSHATAPDDKSAIQAAIRNAAANCDFLVVSGGIGPTDDDLTRHALAVVLGHPLETNELWMSRLVEFFKSRGREMPEINKIQARIPRGAKMIENAVGTAAGIEASIRRLPIIHGANFKRGLFADFPKDYDPVCRIFVLPGVPTEMKAMFTTHVLPIISAAAGGAVILSRTLHTFGLGESAVAEKLGDLMNRTHNPSVGTTVANGIVSLRINSRFPSKDQAQTELESIATQCHEKLGDLIFGQDDDTLPKIVADLLISQSSIINHQSSISTAESCTGGLLAKLLTDIPGSSRYFTQGWVTYSNKSKYERLGVSMEIINIHGAVSEPVVEAMAKNARRLAKSTFALSISGIAGPDGGSAAKPVGTVCIALACPDPADKQKSLVQSRTFLFPGDREMIRDRAAKMALTMLRFHLLQKPMPF